MKNTFLHGDLEEEVYMDIPPSLTLSTLEGRVYKLRKALYGLKQSPRAWFERLAKAMQKFSFSQCQCQTFKRRESDSSDCVY